MGIHGHPGISPSNPDFPAGKKEWVQHTDNTSRGASARQTSSGLTDGFKGKVGEAIGLVAE